jgi:GTP 3',8-cyclase
MRDSFERTIRYLRVSVTDRCNLRCVYCAPEGGLGCAGSGTGRALGFDEIEAIVRAAVRLGVDKVRLTGGEPLLREGLVQLVARLAPIPGLSALAMTTNGSLLAPAARGLAEAGLGSVNVSLDSVDPAEYALLTGGGRVEAAMAGIEAAVSAGMAVALNVVVDEEESAAAARAEAVEAYARRLGLACRRIRRYDPRGPKVEAPGFDRPPPCGECDRIRLLSDGRLLPCLHSSAFVETDLGRIEESLLACVAMKPRRGYGGAAASLRAIGG